MELTVEEVCALAPVIPVVVIDDVDDAVPLAEALVRGGLPAIEVTLRTHAALAAIERIAEEVEGAVVGAGTVTTTAQIADALSAGARFLVSPGATPTLLDGLQAAVSRSSPERRRPRTWWRWSSVGSPTPSSSRPRSSGV